MAPCCSRRCCAKSTIEPILVSLPHHCYVAFYLDKEHTQLVGLETTLLGAEMDENADYELPGVTDVVDDEWQATNSWRTFCTAIESATTDLAANADKFDKDDPDYQLVRIKEARTEGVLPIAFDGRKFVPATNDARRLALQKADGEGFEPPGALAHPAVFKTAAFDHSATHPITRSISEQLPHSYPVAWVTVRSRTSKTTRKWLKSKPTAGVVSETGISLRKSCAASRSPARGGLRNGVATWPTAIDATCLPGYKRDSRHCGGKRF